MARFAGATHIYSWSFVTGQAEQFADIIATGNNGMIMKKVMAEFKGKADGKQISQMVAELCKG